MNRDSWPAYRVPRAQVVPAFVRRWIEGNRGFGHRPQKRPTANDPSVVVWVDASTLKLWEQLRQERMEIFSLAESHKVAWYGFDLETQLRENEQFLVKHAQLGLRLPPDAHGLLVSESFSRIYLGKVSGGEGFSFASPPGGLQGADGKPYWENPIPKAMFLDRREMLSAIQNMAMGWTFRTTVHSQPSQSEVRVASPPPKPRIAAQYGPTKIEELHAIFEPSILTDDASSPPLQFGNDLETAFTQFNDHQKKVNNPKLKMVADFLDLDMEDLLQAMDELGISEDEIISLAADFTPFVGSVKSGLQLILGEDLVTGEKVNRWGELVGIIPYAKVFTKASDTSKIAKKIMQWKKKKKIIPKVSYARPTHYRKGLKDKVWENAKGPDGKVRDPVTNVEIKKSDSWDMGHKPGFEFRKHQKSAKDRGISRQEFLDEYNDPSHFRPELPSSNRSHKGELISDEYYGP